MDKREVLSSLQEMFNKENNVSDYIIESKQIDDCDYLTLITKDKEDFVATHPDYDAFINLLKYYNTKESNYAASKLNDNKVKIFTEYSAEEQDKLINEMKDLYSRLASSNQRNIAFVEMMIVDWINKRF